MNNQYIFSYGTLQNSDVQQAIFHRDLKGQQDSLPGYKIEMLTITNPEVVQKSGLSQHPVAVKTDKDTDEIAGQVFSVSEKELAHADHYESADYQRILVSLKSGIKAWMYVSK